MTKNSTLIVNYNPIISEDDESCPHFKIEVFQDSPLFVGSTIDINVVGSGVYSVGALRLFLNTSNLGAPSIKNDSQSLFTETVIFKGSSVASLNWPFVSIKSAKVLGGGLYKEEKGVLSLFYTGNTSISTLSKIGGSCIKIPSSPGTKFYGGIEVIAQRMKTYGQWTWKLQSAGVFSFFVKEGILDTSPVLYTFQIDASEALPIEGGPQPVTIKVYNSITNVPVNLAQVYINGQLKGTTDVNGIVSLGTMKPGAYSLKVKHALYMDTDLDDIENDSFIVGTVG